MVEHDGNVIGARGAVQQRDTLLSDEMRLKLMRLFEANPHLSQRDAARELGISLGKVNYCLKALMHRGWIKANRFRNSRHKAAYRYLLTPRGIEAKTALTVRFLRIKVREYETLRTEIEQLRREAASRGREGRPSQP